MLKTHRTPRQKFFLVLIIIVLIGLIGGLIFMFYLIHQDPEIFQFNRPEYREPIYSDLTGLEIDDAKLNQAPTFCVQISNGSTDGARPQAGLSKAAVVFEAIAETGITRFAAIFQNPDTGVIGPIRSLRPYYLEWDTPFDCTIVHDGGSDEALSAVASGGYRNLDEDFNYMWRETYVNGQYRYWNNVFTSPKQLLAFNEAKNYTTSEPKTFPRLTPEEAENQKIALHPESAAESTPAATLANHIHMTFTGLTDYNVSYDYDLASNTYARSYGNGAAHVVYDCPITSEQFEHCTGTVQVAPSAVAVLRVQENTMADGYHEDIRTISQGVAYIFQNGEVIEATWKKSSLRSQIQFTAADGTEIQFTPGQLWIAAIPQFGSVSWE